MVHPDAPCTLGFTPDSRTLMTSCSDGVVWRWDAATGEAIDRVLQNRPGATGVIFSPDGRTVLSAAGDGTGRLFDLATQRPIAAPLENQTGPIGLAKFSPNGRRLMTFGADHAARVWQVPAPVEGDLERILLWVQVMTGLELASNDVVNVLDAPTWHQRRQRLERLGGPPDLYHVRVNDYK
jgi:WD40 repeat protein